MDRAQIIRDYFQSWIDKEPSVMESYFADDIHYTECYGPVYVGKAQCRRWFKDWNKNGQVLKWQVHSIDGVGDTYYVEWYFECDFDNSIGGFDGVSIVEFSENQITAVREFQSKSEHYYPYEVSD